MTALRECGPRERLSPHSPTNSERPDRTSRSQSLQAPALVECGHPVRAQVSKPARLLPRRRRASCTKWGGAPLRRPASLRIRVESPVSRDGGWTGQFNVWTRSCASVNGPNPILMSENVGECAHPESRGPRSRGRRVQTLLSLLCSLDSPPLPVALWVATMFSVTLFVPPRRLPYSVLFSLSADGWFLPADGTKPTSRASRSASSRLECTPNRS